MPQPVFILAPPCTFSWVVCAMLGQHPQMYALPELHLFTAATVEEWCELADASSFHMDHGLVRAIAELYYDEQNDVTVSRARGWLRRRAHFTTGYLLEALLDRLSPLVAVEKSPSVVFGTAGLDRARAMFPGARYVQLVSHPRLYGELVVDSLGAAERQQPLDRSHWLVQLASGGNGGGEVVDPQAGWLAANRTIAGFLAGVPEEQRRVVRGEALLQPRSGTLASLAAWLGLRTDAAAVEAMRHPERSPYARLGPPTAAFGSDAFLRGRALLEPEWTQRRSLEGPLSWRLDGAGFLPEVHEMATELGYT
jgi:hypothetical protein